MTDGAAPLPPVTTRSADWSGTRIVSRIISGGQTGVDQAALDAALAAGIDCGGWIPRGRRTENGPLPTHYPLRETHSSGYAERTRLNVRDSDGTLILCRGAPSGGTRLTVAFAARARRPCLIVDLGSSTGGNADLAQVHHWVHRQRIAILNVAGPRESGCPGIYEQARNVLDQLLLGTGGG